MKNAILTFLLLVVTISCSKDDDVVMVQSTNVSTEAQTLYTGVLAPTSGIKASGSLKIVLDKNVTKLVFENANIESGPDLKVYLSKTNTPTEYINLGSLSATATYAIPSNTDLSIYKYVLIHCQQYNHLFVVSELIKK